MKHIKKYEKIKDNINVGDHVLGIYIENIYPKLEEFLNTNVGIVIEKQQFYFLVKYKNVSNATIEYMLAYTSDDLIEKNEYSYPLGRGHIILATPEEIEHQKIKNSASKYNL